MYDGRWVALAFSLMALVGGAWWCIWRLSQAHHLRDTPTSKIRSAAQGFVELCGVLHEQGMPQQAPLTRQACLWWRYRIEEYRRAGKNSRWQVVESATSDAWLLLDDGSGQCLIDPLGAEVRPATRQVWEGSLRHPLGEAPSGFRALLSFGKRYRYTEERLHAGQPLYAIGWLQTQGGGRQANNEQRRQAELIRQWKADYPDLLRRFDRNRDGQLDAQEWQRVQLAARLEAQEEQQRAVQAPLQQVLSKPAEGLPYILSCAGEDELLRKFYWQALGGALLCLAGAAASHWLWQRLW